MASFLDGATILVTGASSGIGREMALQLASRARALVILARRRERLEALRDQLREARGDLTVHVLVCDLSDVGQVEEALSTLEREVGDVDVLINNAGIGDYGLFERASWDKTRLMIDVNVTALTLLTRRLLPPMVARGRGGVLNVSSGFGLTFLPGFAAYGATKNYVTSFTEALRGEVRGTGVTITQVCPGPVSTEFGEVAELSGPADVPSAVQYSPEQVCRTAIRGFERGRPLVIPGVLMRMLMLLAAFTPRAVLRLLHLIWARQLRGKASPP